MDSRFRGNDCVWEVAPLAKLRVLRRKESPPIPMSLRLGRAVPLPEFDLGSPPP